MASKWKKLFQHLEAHGKRAPATVLEVSSYGTEVSSGGFSLLDLVGMGSSDTFHVHKTALRIRPPDGAEFEVKAKMAYGVSAIPDAGQEIEVLYDPDDPEKVMVAPPTAEQRSTVDLSQAKIGFTIGGGKKPKQK
jgi:hypothetical protein